MFNSNIFDYLGVEDNQVLLQNASEKYKLIFEYEKKEILNLLGNVCIAIEHIGSTSIKGLVAKPIVDIAVGVLDMHTLESIPPIMIMEGYQYLSEHGDHDRLLFIKKKNGKCFLHIHVEIYQGKSWENHLLFKKYLEHNSKALLEYSELKERLAAEYYNDRKLYTVGKADFIQSCLKEIKKTSIII